MTSRFHAELSADGTRYTLTWQSDHPQWQTTTPPASPYRIEIHWVDHQPDGHFPVAFDYEPPASQSPFPAVVGTGAAGGDALAAQRTGHPTIRIVAAPGVKITRSEHDPESAHQELVLDRAIDAGMHRHGVTRLPPVPPPAETLRVRVIRVQSADDVPPIGVSLAGIAAGQYRSVPHGHRLAEGERDWPGEEGDDAPAGPVADPASAVEVYQQDDGVIFHHPHEERTIIVTVPLDSTSARRSGGGEHWRQRFAYELDKTSLADPHAARLTILCTPGVTVLIHDDRDPVRVLREPPGPHAFTVAVFDARLDQVPQQGAALAPTGTRRDHRHDLFGRRTQDAVEMVHLIFSLVPGTGDLVDIGDFVSVVFTRHDLTGRPVTSNLEFTFMGVCALLPVMSGSSRSALLLVFGRHADRADDLRTGLRARLPPALLADLAHAPDEVLAQFDALPAETLRAMGGRDRSELALRRVVAHLRAGRPFRQLPRQVLGQAHAALLRAMRGAARHGVDHIISANGRDFTSELVRQAYHDALRRRGLTADELSPQQWLRSVAGGSRADQLLHLVLGPQWRSTLPTTRYRNLVSIPRPALLDEATGSGTRQDELVARLGEDLDTLGDRLGNMIEEIRGLPPRLRTRAQLSLNEGHLRILQGNIGEILARPRMLELLERARSAHPGAVLVTGARYRPAGRPGGSQLFIDGLIVVFHGSGAQREARLLDRFEVKTMRNAQAGIDQHVLTAETRMGGHDVHGTAEQAALVVGPSSPDAILLDPERVRVFDGTAAAGVPLGRYGDGDLGGAYLIGASSGPGRRSVQTQTSTRHVLIPGGFDPQGASTTGVLTGFDLAGELLVHESMGATYDEVYYLLVEAVELLKRHHGL